MKGRTLPWISHECCGSRVRNRHLSSCSLRVPRERELPSDLQVRIWEMKHAGLTSGDVHGELHDEFPDLRLGDINKLYA